MAYLEGLDVGLGLGVDHLDHHGLLAQDTCTHNIMVTKGFSEKQGDEGWLLCPTIVQRRPHIIINPQALDRIELRGVPGVTLLAKTPVR